MASKRSSRGNVLFLRGDLGGAKAAYLAAVDRAQDPSTLAAAHYDLSKLYLRQLAVEQSTEARKKAQQQDAEFLARHGPDADFSATRWLIDAPVPLDQITALTRGDPGPAALAAAVEARLAGPVPRRAWPWLPLGLAAALWPLALAARRLEPARSCGRCGRPACRRCDGVSEALCGQCVNVFQRAAAVDPRDRALKEGHVEEGHRAHALHPRRAHHRPALRRHQAAARGPAPARRAGQHGGGDRAPPRRDEDLGLGDRPSPEDGDGGGRVVAVGTPEELAACEASYTGRFLRGVL